MTLARCRTILVIGVFLVFGRLLWCDFTWWDDSMTVHQNNLMNHVGWDTFTYNWTTPTADIYIPLTYTVWGLVAMAAKVPPDNQGIELNATFFHLTNILVHAAGALAAFGLLRRLTNYTPAALLGALFWAVHPVQVESVGWVSGLKDVLSGTLVLCSLLLYVRWRQDGPRWWFVAALAVYALAMLAKPAAFTTPLLVVAIDRLLLGTSWRKIGLAVTPMIVLAIPIAVIARHAQPSPTSEGPVWTRLFVAGDALAFYLAKDLFPARLAIDYGRNTAWLIRQPQTYYTWLLPAAVAGAVVWASRRAKRQGRTVSYLPAAGLLVFAFAPLHVLGFVRFDFELISLVADHYQYVAVFGLAMVLAWAVTRWPKFTAVAWVLVAAYGVRAAWQTPVWQDEDTLMHHTLSVNPRSWMAYTNMAVQASKLGDHATEREYLLKAESFEPDNPTILIGLMTVHINAKEWTDADRYARKIVEIYNRYWLPTGAPPGPAYYKAIDSYFTTGRLDDAERYVNEALSRDPSDPTLQRYAERIKWKRQAETKPPTSAPAPAGTRPAV